MPYKYIYINITNLIKCFIIIYKELIANKSYTQPQLIWDYPLNLSILIRGGKETNQDFLSSGERKEISSALSHFVYMANVRCSVWSVNILV